MLVSNTVFNRRMYAKQLEQEDFIALDDLILEQKLSGKTDILGIYRAMGIDETKNVSVNYEEVESYSPERATKILIALALPSIGPLGSALTNCDLVRTQPSGWYRPGSFANGDPSTFYFEILEGMTQGNVTNVAVSDVAPILSPVKIFRDFHLKSQLFPLTLSRYDG
jgi:hypothetical protein